HLPHPRPSLARARHAGRHQDGGAGGELSHPLPRGRPRHVAVPLPRRGAHDEGDDRPVPGAPAMIGMALAAMAAASMGGEGTTVAIPGRFYAPQYVTVLVGQPVAWRNDDATEHTVTSPDAGFDSGRVGTGATFSFTFDQPGVYAYHCTIHRYMKGTVEVDTLALHPPPAPTPVGDPATLDGLAPAGTGEVT